MNKGLEALENIRYIIVFDERLVDEDGDDDPKKIFIDEICPQDYAIIKEELEILEILKDNLFIEEGTGRFKGLKVVNCSLGNQHSGSDFEKVEAWLNRQKIA